MSCEGRFHRVRKAFRQPGVFRESTCKVKSGSCELERDANLYEGKESECQLLPAAKKRYSNNYYSSFYSGKNGPAEQYCAGQPTLPVGGWSVITFFEPCDGDYCRHQRK